MSGAVAAPALTVEQELAVARRSEPLLLAAGAGSGKTSVLVARVLRAVREDGVPPGAVLAITFTERAAGELRERIRAGLLGLGDRDAARELEAAFVGTFHGFCARLLRAHALAAELDPEFAVLDEGLAARLRERAFTTALTAFLEGERAAAVDLVAAYRVDRVRATVEGVYAELRSRGERAPALPLPAPAPADADARAGVQACALFDELLRGFGVAYEQLKHARGAVDFDDLELRALELLHGHPRIRAAWSERFELLMVDEFQDTNPRQLAILEALDRDNLFTVGDAQQSIYAFRHADVALFRERRERLQAAGASLELTRNFRSHPAVLEVVNVVFAERLREFPRLVAGRDDDARALRAGHGARRERPVPLVSGQLALDIEPSPLGEAPSPRVELLIAARSGWERDRRLADALGAGLPRAPAWRHAEARLLAERVRRLVADGDARPGEVAVLLRGLGDVEVYERALRLAGLPTLATVGGFWSSQQVQDLLAYMRTVANPLDEEAVYGVLASPLCGCSADGLALVAGAARKRGTGVWEAVTALADVLAPADREALARIREHMDDARARAATRTLAAILEGALDGLGYRRHVRALRWGGRRLANVHKLLRLARRHEAEEGRDLRGFLDHAAQLALAAEPDAPPEGAEPDAVRLMSVHAAKGLEFPVVCVADLARTPNTGLPTLLVDGRRLGLRLVRLDGAPGTPVLDYEDLVEQRRAAQAEEEDRILYVAMTRARERLLLSGSVELGRWPDDRPGAAPIAWLGPALSPELAQLVADSPAATFEVGVGRAAVRCTVLSVDSAAELLGPGAPSAQTGPAPTPAPAVTPAPAPTPGAAPTTALQAPAPPGSASPQPAPAPPPAANAPAPRTAPTTLSYTALSELERCGYRYYLERVVGLGEDRSAARSAGPRRLEGRARGTLVHRLLETYGEGARAPSAQDVGRAADELGLRVAPQERERLARLVAGVLSSPPVAALAGAARVRREHPFAFALGPDEALLTGVIDVLAQDGDGAATIVDYKSDRVEADVDLESLAQREYGLQRLVYGLAALRAGAPSVEVVHVFLERAGEHVSVRWQAGERAALEGSLRARVRLAATETYAVSARPHRGLCLTCPGRAALCSWDEQETLRERPPAVGERREA